MTTNVIIDWDQHPASSSAKQVMWRGNGLRKVPLPELKGAVIKRAYVGRDRRLHLSVQLSVRATE